MTTDALFDAEAVKCPFPYFEALRQHEPVHAVDASGVFLVTRLSSATA